MEQPQQRRGDTLAQQRHQHAAENRNQYGRMHRFLDLVLVSAFNRVGNDHVCPQRDADEQIDDQPDARAVCPNRHHSGRALRGAGEIAGHRHI